MEANELIDHLIAGFKKDESFLKNKILEVTEQTEAEFWYGILWQIKETRSVVESWRDSKKGDKNG